MTSSVVTVVALYKFVDLPDFREIQPRLLQVCQENQIKGSILLAEEGINGTIAGDLAGIQNVQKYLAEDARFSGIEYKYSEADFIPFRRTKVRLKKEIVTMGIPGTDPRTQSGRYATPEEWNQLLQDPEVVVIDTRNQYETDVGTFKAATVPKTMNFREFPEFVQQELDPKRHKKVAMFCTGGIRCEKASSYMLNHGFEEVYQLKGGILKYLEAVPESESLWQGECFVFDDRVTVDHQLQKGKYALCHACRHPLTIHEVASADFVQGISCPHCKERSSEDKARYATRQKQIEQARRTP